MVGVTKAKLGERSWDNQLSKTKMCKFHLQGRCTKGLQCPFAHHLEELREQPNLQQTKLCKVLIQTGRCDNKNCTYAHDKDELRYASSFTSYKTKFCRFMESGTCSLGSKCNFAHSASELRAAVETPSPPVRLPLPEEAEAAAQDLSIPPWSASIAPPPGLSMESVFGKTPQIKVASESPFQNLSSLDSFRSSEDQFAPAYVHLDPLKLDVWKSSSVSPTSCGWESEKFLDVLVDRIRQAQTEFVAQTEYSCNLAASSTFSSFLPLDEATPSASTPSELGGADLSMVEGIGSVNHKDTVKLADAASLKLNALYYPGLKSDTP